MFSDRMMDASVGGFVWPVPRAVHFLVVGSLFVIAGVLAPSEGSSRSLFVCGALFFGLAGLVAVGRLMRARLIRMQQSLTAQVVAADEAACFVTDGSGRLVSYNSAAKARFPQSSAPNLTALLSHLLANPQAILTPLLQKADRQGAACEDIVTRGGHFLLRVVRIGPECFLWSLPEQGRTGQAAGVVFSGGVPVVTVARDGRVIDCNGAFRAATGGTFAHLADLMSHPPQRNGGVQEVRLQGGTQRFSVFEVPASEGRRNIYLLPPPDDQALPPPVNADWDSIEDLPVPLLKICNDGRLLSSNREARQLLNIVTSEGRKLSDVMEGPGRPINDWLAQAIMGQGAHVSEFLRVRADNHDTFVQVTLTSSGTGDEMYLIAVLNDVTELKTLEAQFVQSQKMQAIGQLAGGIAHDFNNLLTAISGHCDLLLLCHDEGHQNYADLIQIHQNANRAASLVGQLLAFSRKQTLQLETLDLRDTLSDLTHLLNRLVGEKVTLSLDHATGLAPIRADRRQMEQVFMNLVVNARDAMNGAGKIRIVTKNVSLASQMRKDRAIVPPGEYVVVNVIDEGSGIPPERLPKIFEPFYTTKRTGEGTGLGLSTAYGIVKQTGGYIFAESEVGQGTTFSLLFPRYHAAAGAQALPARAPETPQLGSVADGVVLLVEDEAPVRAFASRALRLKGYTVLEADCAEAALQMLADSELHVDIFVTDVIMPGLDGPSWVRLALRDRPGTKVVFVSGYPEDAFEDGAAVIPQAIFLPKPFSLTALTQTVQGQLHGPVAEGVD